MPTKVDAGHGPAAAGAPLATMKDLCGDVCSAPVPERKGEVVGEQELDSSTGSRVSSPAHAASSDGDKGCHRSESHGTGRELEHDQELVLPEWPARQIPDKIPASSGEGTELAETCVDAGAGKKHASDEAPRTENPGAAVAQVG